MEIQVWGRNFAGQRAITVRVGESEHRSEAAARSIARRAGLRVCGGPRQDSCTPNSVVYQVSLGRRLGDGTYTNVVERWFSMPTKVES